MKNTSKFFKLAFLIFFSFGFGQLKAQTCYELVWSDEFNTPGLPDSSKWTFETGGGGWGNNELQYYTSRTENARIEDTVLIIEARKEAYGGKQYTSARLITYYNNHLWKYGKMEAKIKLPYGQGIWPAFWMLGQGIFNGNPWPACGEIDIMEMVGGGEGRDDKTYGTAHWADANGDHAQYGGSYQLATGIYADTFHVFAIEWAVNYIKWFVDGKQFHVIDISPSTLSEFRDDYFILLNIAVGGNWPGSPNSSTVFPQQMQVDYVRVYQLTTPEITGKTDVIKAEKDISFSTVDFEGYLYNWSVPEGATITGGQGTAKITVDWGCLPGNVTCELTTYCDTYSLTLPVEIANLSIDGPTLVDANELNLKYYVPESLGTSYTWHFPASVTNTTLNGSNSIYLNWGPTDGEITVTTENSCGIETADLWVTVLRQLPYPDIHTPATIPGTIQSVNYDYGGEGVAYHDAEVDNQGTGTRQDEGVDTQANDGGENVGWTITGEWLEYTIKVDEEKTYDAEIRVASTSSTGKFRILFNGEDRTGTVSVASTGSWSTFKSVFLNDIPLKTTDTLMRIEFVAGNFNMGRLIWDDEFFSSVSENSGSPVILYPNVTSSNVFVGNLHQKATFTICDVTGKTVISGDVENESPIDVSSLKSGSYLMVVTEGDIKSTLKFIKF